MGFGVLNAENVYKVVDQPHPTALKEVWRKCCRRKDGDGRVLFVVLFDMIIAMVCSWFELMKIVNDLFLV